jgi:hypothetical protein
MDPTERYNKFVTEKFLSNLMGFNVYYNDFMESYWWINPETKDWRFEMEKTGTLWYNSDWGKEFIDSTALSDPEFRLIVETFIHLTISLQVKKLIPDKIFDDFYIGVENSILKCLSDQKVIVTPTIGVKNFYQINEMNDIVEHILKNY